MSIFVWNVWASLPTYDDVICDFIYNSSRHPWLVFWKLKVKKHILIESKNCFPSSWQTYANYSEHSSSRIWVLWNPSVWTCSTVSSSSQQIFIDALQIKVAFSTFFSFMEITSLLLDLCYGQISLVYQN